MVAQELKRYVVMAIFGLKTNMPKQLFLKILLGFWLITVLIAGTIVALPAIIESSRQLSPEQAKLHQRIVNTIQKAATLQEGLKIAEHALSKVRVPAFMKKKRGRFKRIYVIDKEKNAVNVRNLPKDINLAIVRHQEEPHRNGYYFKRWAVFGPYKLTFKNLDYQLYIRDPIHKHRTSVLSTLRDNRWLLLFIVMAVSALSCALLAWHIVKPIKSLDRSAKRLAQGDLATRAESDALAHRDEIGQLAKSFNHMADSVEKMLQGQQRLLGDISHELRTPLTRLQLANAISRRKNGESEELNRIEQETQTLDKMLQQLLMLSRYQLANEHPFEVCQLDQFMDDIIDNATFEAKEHGIELVTHIAPQLNLLVQWDPLASAIENIIRNAIRYAKTQITIDATAQDQSLIIIIADDGSGVPQEHLANLFTPFYRVSSARDRSSGGTGLGLAIAYEAVVRHQGSITAFNNKSGGLSIKITLPLTRNA